MDWPSVAVGAGAALAMVAMGASPLIRFAMGHRAALVAEIEKERTRRVSAERGIADLLESVEVLRRSLEKAARELAIALRDLMMLRAENQALRRDSALREPGGTPL
jgi:hypothetical protein